VILGPGANAGDVETLTELARRGVAQLVISDTMQPAGFDVLAPGAGEPGGQAAEAGSAVGSEAFFERAVAMLLGRLHGQAPAEGTRADAGG
jgi:hypothetical protein